MKRVATALSSMLCLARLVLVDTCEYQTQRKQCYDGNRPFLTYIPTS